MRRSTGLALLSLTLFLVIFPLAVGKPGLPMTLKADEPAYYLMALSLARDFDLRCEMRDLGRLFDEYPYLATFNLILMTDDGWHTVFFGKPFIYSLFASPFAGLFGANGLVAFNMSLLLGMVWMGTVYLSRYNSWPLAALYASGFFLLSTSFAYVFWLHPEIFNMACVTASLFLVLQGFEEKAGGGRWQSRLRPLVGRTLAPAGSGAALALAIYNKPMLVAMALPSLFVFWRRRDLRAAAAWVVGCAGTLLVVAGLSIGFTGHASAYLGVERMGVPVFDPQQMPIEPVSRPPQTGTPTTNSWSWLARIPEIDGGELRTNLAFFLWGRHTGLIPYMPFAVLSLLLFLLGSRASPVRWLTLGAIAAFGLFFLIWIPFNWHGGGGFVGNRYFVNVYPAFVFLVTRIQPTWLTAAGYAVAGLLVGPIVFTPFGAPVPEPTLQAHVRNPPLRFFPLELNFRRKLPGYQGQGFSGAWFFGRKDVFRPHEDEMWIHGATPVELWMMVSAPLHEEVVFQVRNYAPGNRITFDMAGERRVIDFAAERGEAAASQRIELQPGGSPEVLAEGRGHVYAYRILVETRTGFIPDAAENARRKWPINEFYLGTALLYLGPRSDLERDLFRVRWQDCEMPTRGVAGEMLTVRSRITNDSQEIWPASGPTRVNLSYRWLDADGYPVGEEGRRTPLPGNIDPGATFRVEQAVLAPDRPGVYELELDLVRERVRWFSQVRPGEPCRGEIEIQSGESSRDNPAPRAVDGSPRPSRALLPPRPDRGAHRTAERTTARRATPVAGLFQPGALRPGSRFPRDRWKDRRGPAAFSVPRSTVARPSPVRR